MEHTFVQTLWVDPVMGEHQKICLQTFIDKGQTVQLYTYNSVSNIPPKVQIMDANEILPSSAIFKDLYNSYATFSDWFRIKLLYDRGGWWVDSDMLCINPFNISQPYVFATETERIDGEVVTHICNCVIKMPAKSSMGASILSKIEDTLKITDPRHISWTAIGAQFMAVEIVERDMFDYVVAPEVFCPYDYARFQEIFSKSEDALPEITYGVHLWNKMWEFCDRNPLENPLTGTVFSHYVKL